MASPEYNMFFDHVDSQDGESSSSSAESGGFFSLDKNNNVTQHEQSGTHLCRMENYTDQGQSVPIRVSKHPGPGGNSPLPPRSDSRSKPSTSYSPILPSSTQRTSSAQRRWSHCDTLDGDQLDSIAKGMRSNERISKQKKGVRIAGRRLGKVKSKRRKKENNTEPGASGDQRKARKSDKATTTSRDSVSEKCSPRRHGQEEKKRRKRRRKRPHPQPPPEGQVRRSESLYKLATNPCHLDPNMEHNKTVHTQFGGHITQLTEPQPKIRRRRRSNQVKDPQMDFDL